MNRKNHASVVRLTSLALLAALVVVLQTVASGIRIGTPAATTRGFDEADFREIAKLIYMTATQYPEKADDIRAAVTALCDKHPLYQ